MVITTQLHRLQTLVFRTPCNREDAKMVRDKGSKKLSQDDKVVVKAARILATKSKEKKKRSSYLSEESGENSDDSNRSVEKVNVESQYSLVYELFVCILLWTRR